MVNRSSVEDVELNREGVVSIFLFFNSNKRLTIGLILLNIILGMSIFFLLPSEFVYYYLAASFIVMGVLNIQIAKLYRFSTAKFILRLFLTMPSLQLFMIPISSMMMEINPTVFKYGIISFPFAMVCCGIVFVIALVMYLIHLR
ncbi:hypothetical protein SAMN02745751_03710 [Dethiosulfatibacter aminovorans DSM 17477]|uniref:ABC-2 family transporter protein n=1 Tax=Dethiosulfatibacter aminovorans DSM 17477 TaxID=1121476 RepID=A0A1M6N8U3_9FIRM|nr:hypothetical protein SAMN02745751_03710 [Dethiosulfatibacter aminovorans DSM 17477]